MARFFASCTLLMLSGIVVVCPVMASGHREPSFFRDIAGKEWKLIALKTGSGNRGFNRQNRETEDLGNAYTLYFDIQQLSGTGAPNRYFAPYTLGEGQAISIQTIASTLMMSLNEPLDLRESEYFAHLEKVSHWDFFQGKLSLYTLYPEGQQEVLLFSSD
ncbi:MAG: META domain-containing protein [Treponema sp.]|jgi:heat shock protein HslJ|nr:META domain-containing protein [Treponema sp.]